MKKTSGELKHVLEVLSGIKGVMHAFYLTKEMRSGLARIEKQYPSIGPLTIKNDGVREALRREHVACIIKDRNFRAPPHSTVLLKNIHGEIIGRELLPGEKPRKGPKDKLIFLGNDFVVYYEKGTGKGAHFVLPPVPFSEVEAIKGTSRVVSSSPSTAGDFFLRRKAGIEDDPKLASILIGFDLG